MVVDARFRWVESGWMGKESSRLSVWVGLEGFSQGVILGRSLMPEASGRSLAQDCVTVTLVVKLKVK